jgi:hypothetical protein
MPGEIPVTGDIEPENEELKKQRFAPGKNGRRSAEGTTALAFTSTDLIDPKLLKPGVINDKGMLARLYSAGLTHEEIADYFGVTRVAVTKMIMREGLERDLTDPIAFKENMHDEILRRMEILLRYMSPDKMNKASLSQLIMAFGTLYDKMRLHRGESTANVASVNIHKIDPSDLKHIREIISRQTAKKLTEVKKEYELQDSL